MENNKNLDNSPILLIYTTIILIVLITIYTFGWGSYFLFFKKGSVDIAIDKIKVEVIETINYWQAPTENEILNEKNATEIAYGKDLIVNTSHYFGNKGIVKPMNTNGMNCQNCHLEAGTKTFGNNYSGFMANFPKYRARSGKIESPEKRINDCFERSLNGKPLAENSKEMKAMIAYMTWVGKNVPKKSKPLGVGFKEITLLDRAANPNLGKILYEKKCASCHQANGEGVLNEQKSGFTYPPLWGNKSYNDGAGLYRISNFAKFIKYNMPQGVTHDNPILSDEEAWDIAAFVNSQTRPHISTKNDWPKIEEKPFDHPFGPYSDNFTEIQHKFGPFQEIKKSK